MVILLGAGVNHFLPQVLDVPGASTLHILEHESQVLGILAPSISLAPRPVEFNLTEPRKTSEALPNPRGIPHGEEFGKEEVHDLRTEHRILGALACRDLS